MTNSYITFRPPFFAIRNISKWSVVLLLLAACTPQPQQERQNTFAPKVVEAKGYMVPKSKMNKPTPVPIRNPKVIRAGKTNVVPTNTNIYPAGKPNVVIAGTPTVCTPGKGGFLLPTTLPALDRPVIAGIPEVVIAKDAHIKDQNPQNFSNFGKQQGLTHNRIKCVLQDKNGNLWFGTDGGGVTRFDGKFLTHFTQKEGLSNNTVWAILQDNAGNLWFGTDGGGVSKYDGKSFTNFTEKEGLSNNTVWAIIQDKSGNIWIGTDGGVNRYDGNNFTHFTEKEGLSSNGVHSILQDQSGNLWFGTHGGGVSKYDGKCFTNITTKGGLSNNYINAILQDQSGSLWFGTNSGVTQLSADGKYFSRFTEKEGLCNNSVFSILQDQDGYLWFGTNNGVCKYDKKTLPDERASFTHFTEKEGLCNNTVWSIFQVQRGIIWFGTFGGISEYNGKTFTHFTEKEGLSNNYINSILQDKNGNLWLGSEGGGVSKYNGKNFSGFTQKEGLSSNQVTSILQDRSGNLWFGTYGGGISKYDGKNFTLFTEKEGLSSNKVTSILQDKRGNLWIGTYGGGVTKYDGKNFTHFTEEEGLSNNRISSILEDKNGNLWFGTDGGGVTKFDGKYFTQFTEEEGLSNDYVTSVLQDRNGNLWFGTSGGVTEFDGKNFIHFTEKEGLSNNNVLSILEDKNGDLWFGTRFGISRLRIKVLEFRINNPKFPLFKNYTYEDGFLGTGCNKNSICEDKSGTIWIGSNDMLTAYHPEGDDTDTIPPNMQVTGLELFNETIPWPDLEKKKDSSHILENGIRLSDFEFDSTSRWYGVPENLRLAYNNNYLTFNFIGITQKQSKKVNYQFKLEGIDASWSALTNRTSATYGNLPRGKYTFKVKAINSDGYWSNEFNYGVTIRPPWWETWWFKSIYIFAIMLVLYAIYRWRTASLIKRQAELVIKVQEATAEIVEKNEELSQQTEEIQNTLDYLKATQAQLIQSEKMAALGQLIAGVAHEINTPLGAIKSSVGNITDTLNAELKNWPDFFKRVTEETQAIIFSILEISLTKDLNITSKEERRIKKELTLELEALDVPNAAIIADLLVDIGVYQITDNISALLKAPNSKEILMMVYKLSGLFRSSQTIQIATDRASKIVFALRNFSHFDNTGEPIKANVVEGIETVLTLYHNSLKHGIEVIKHYTEVPAIYCFPDELNQVWTNIVHNAIHAMKSNGTLTIAVGLAAEKMICVSFTDTGSGIPVEIKERIFEAFFTTKPQGEGSGLGLDIVRRIIDRHKGTVKVESEPGNTKFSIYLPTND